MQRYDCVKTPCCKCSFHQLVNKDFLAAERKSIPSRSLQIDPKMVSFGCQRFIEQCLDEELLIHLGEHGLEDGVGRIWGALPDRGV